MQQCFSILTSNVLLKRTKSSTAYQARKPFVALQTISGRVHPAMLSLPGSAVHALCRKGPVLRPIVSIMMSMIAGAPLSALFILQLRPSDLCFQPRRQSLHVSSQHEIACPGLGGLLLPCQLDEMACGSEHPASSSGPPETGALREGGPNKGPPGRCTMSGETGPCPR